MVDQTGLQAGNVTIEVLCNGTALTDPYVAVVRLRNSGRHAIASEQFDQQRPLQIDLGAAVVELLSVEAGQHAPVVSSWAVSGTTISFGPELIRRGQEITFTALVEGMPLLDVRDHFVDVQLKQASTEGAGAAVPVFVQRLLEAAGATGAAAIVAAIASLLS